MISLITLLAAPLLSEGTVCPIMANPVDANATHYLYGGLDFAFCCNGCDDAFAKDPQAAMAKASKTGKVYAEFMFDPVSHKRVLDVAKAAATVEYKGVRYRFNSVENKKKFEAKPSDFTAMPKNETLVCAVMGDAIQSIDAADSYVDYKGVRYYMCCGSCLAPMMKSPEKFAVSANGVGPAKMMPKPIEDKSGR